MHIALLFNNVTAYIIKVVVLSIKIGLLLLTEVNVKNNPIVIQNIIWIRSNWITSLFLFFGFILLSSFK